MSEKVKAPVRGGEKENGITGLQCKDSENYAMLQVPTIKKDAFDRLAELIEVSPEIQFGTFKSDELEAKVCENICKTASEYGIRFTDSPAGLISYNGCHWEVCDVKEVLQKVKSICLKLGVPQSRVMSARFMNNVMDILHQCSYNKNIKPPTDNVLINCKNGTYNVGTGQLQEFNPDDGLFYQLDYDYDPTADCPKFKETLKTILPEDDKKMLLQEAIGYLLGKGLNYEAAIFLIGSGSNGKSVILAVVMAMLGKENISSISLTQLFKADSYFLAEMEFKLANICRDTDAKIEDGGLFKSVVSHEPQMVRRIYRPPYCMEDYGSLMFAVNNLPQSNDYSDGFRRRLKFIPFDVTIKDEDKNPNLAKEIISSELSGVLNWAIEGLQRLIENNGRFTDCARSNEMIEHFKLTQNNVAAFVDERRYVPGGKCRQLFSNVFNDYDTYCSNNGYRSCSKGTLKDRLIQLGFEVRIANQGQVHLFYTERCEDNKSVGSSDADLPF